MRKIVRGKIGNLECGGLTPPSSPRLDSAQSGRVRRQAAGTTRLRRAAALQGASIVLSALLVSFCCQAADVSVTASVDRNRVVFGESLTFSLNLMGTQEAPKGGIPKVDGLTFEGPIGDQSINNNGQISRTISFRVTPASLGEFTIPAIEVEVGGKKYSTEPIEITVEKVTAQPELQERLYARIQFDHQPVFLGQTAPLNVVLFSRSDVPLYGLSGFQVEAEGLGYKHLNNVRQGSQIINGVSFNVFIIEGAMTPTRTGTLAFGPAVIKCQLRVGEDWFTGVRVRGVTVPVEPLDIQVLSLPQEGKPADFTGAVGQWNLEVTAKPTELAVGDPITLTVKISGNGNIDTVATPQLQGLDNFKTYDPTSKTTKDELSTTGERVFQQVLVPKSTEAKQLPQVRLSYFDPVAKAYKTAVQVPIQLVVKAGSGGTAVLATGAPARPTERLGQDIVYLKGDLGPVTTATCSYSTIAFWVLNVLPVFSLLGLVAWKQRVDRLRGDVAYARRSRAAKRARRMLAEAKSFDQVQHALQSYLGDRLNIPASGITVSIVDEQLEPRGLDGDLAAALKRCFEVCDNARFAGDGNNETEMRATANKVGELIDALEKIHL
jgi:hypothetical protein